MLYCKDCEYLEHKSCMRPIDHPVHGPDSPLNLSARKQRTIFNLPGYCGIDAQYFKLDTRPIPQEI